MFERMTLALQHEILSHLDAAGADYHRRMQKVLTEGFTAEYDRVFWADAELPYDDCRLVFDILDMFSGMKASIAGCCAGREGPGQARQGQPSARKAHPLQPALRERRERRERRDHHPHVEGGRGGSDHPEVLEPHDRLAEPGEGEAEAVGHVLDAENGTGAPSAVR